MAPLFDIANGVPEGIAALVASTLGVVGAIIKGVKMWRAAQDARMKSVPPTPQLPHATPPNPFGHAPPPTDPALIAIAGAAMQHAKFSLDELRKALDQAGKDQSRIAQREAAANKLKDRLVFELECERQKVASLEAVRAEHERRIAALEAEREHLELRIPTPLRPPRP